MNLRRSTFILLLLLIVGFGFMVPAQAESTGNEILAFFGTYTNSTSKGIYVYKLDLATGKLNTLSVTEGIKNPSYLTIHPNHKFLYAVSETGAASGPPQGSLWAYKLNGKTGELSLLNHQSTQGNGPCFVSIDHEGKTALVANYDDGCVASLPIAEDGTLGEARSVIHHHGQSVDPKRQTGPHAHSINVSPDNKFAIVADLGLDKIISYKLHADKSKIGPSEAAVCVTAFGAGPRHLTFSKNGRFVYVANELNSSVGVYEYKAAKGELAEVQIISTLPVQIPDNTVAEILLDPSGKFLYCSNRGQDCISIFTIDAISGKLSGNGVQKTVGQIPRNFAIDPTGQYLICCNQGSDNVVVFKIDQSKGSLTQVGEPISIPTPVCVKFLNPD